MKWIFLAGALVLPSLAFAQTTQVEIIETGPEVEVENYQGAPTEGYPTHEQQVQPQPAQPAPVATGYVPQATVVEDRLELDQALAQYRIGGSIAMTAIGVGLGLSFSLGAYLVRNASGVARCTGLGDGDCGSTNTRGTAILGTLAAGAFTLGIIGLVRLIVRVSKRSRVRRDYRQRASLDAEGFSLSF